MLDGVLGNRGWLGWVLVFGFSTFSGLDGGTVHIYLACHPKSADTVYTFVPLEVGYRVSCHAFVKSVFPE